MKNKKTTHVILNPEIIVNRLVWLSQVFVVYIYNFLN